MTDFRKSTQSPFSPLIVGLPRTGFSLVGSILTNLFNHTHNKFSAKHKIYQTFARDIGQCFGRTIDRVFREHNLAESLLLNDNFRQLCGGPIWNNDDLGSKAYFRKYIGVRGHGDLTLVIALPLELLDQYELIHSHGPFRDWATLPQYNDYQKFATIRNPPGTINSACHSINALASEYIQQSRKLIDIEKIRRELAYYKLTDLKFFDALLQPMKRGMVDQLSQGQHYRTIAWEDLITKPKETIEGITSDLQVTIDKGLLVHIWDSISYRNLTGSHKHNYRQGKAYVGDEREALVNEHIDIMRASGLEDIALEFGYRKWEYMKESQYTDFQKQVSLALKHGRILDPTPDRFLFDLAFNKSNIDFAAFGFRQHDWLENVRLERSNLKNDELEIALAQECNHTIRDLVRVFGALNSDFQKKDFSWHETRQIFSNTTLPVTTEEVEKFFSKISTITGHKERGKEPPESTQYGKADKPNIKTDILTSAEPRLIEENYKKYNLVSYDNRFFAIHQELGPVELNKIDIQLFNSKRTILFDNSLRGLKRKVNQTGRNRIDLFLSWILQRPN